MPLAECDFRQMVTVSLSPDPVYSLINVGGEIEIENASQNLLRFQVLETYKRVTLENGNRNQSAATRTKKPTTSVTLGSVVCIGLTNVEFKLTSRLRKGPSRTNSAAAHNRRMGARDLSGTCPSSS